VYNGKKILVCVPAYNEEKLIQKTLSNNPWGLIDVIVVIDDGSTDKTYELAKKCEGKNGTKIIVLRNKKNMGVGYSLRRGFEWGLAHGMDIVICAGGDNQEDRHEMIKHCKLLVDENYDYVTGSRYIEGKVIGMPFRRFLLTKLYTTVFNFVARRKTTDASNGYRGIWLRVFKNRKIDIWREGLNRYALETYMLLKVLKSNLKFGEVPVKKFFHVEEGYSKIRVRDWITIAKPVLLNFFRLDDFYYKKIHDPKIDELLMDK
jgi:glycosyltransferase involved in cell wall biosynthesis